MLYTMFSMHENTKGIRNATSNKVYVTVTDLENIKSTSGSNIFSEDSLKTG